MGPYRRQHWRMEGTYDQLCWHHSIQSMGLLNLYVISVIPIAHRLRLLAPEVPVNPLVLLQCHWTQVFV